MLQPIDLPPRLDERSVPESVAEMVRDLGRRIEAFQDRWDVPQIEQFVAADYLLVYQTLDWLGQTPLPTGRRFLEWGCGFAAVTVLAARLGWDAIGIESEPDLLRQGEQTLREWSSEMSGHAELHRGNFLPRGAERLADDPTLPSLGHGDGDGSVYETIGLDLDDFAVIYSYPWPGEDDFHEAVFDRHAAPGAILLNFRGPNEMRAWRRLKPIRKL